MNKTTSTLRGFTIVELLIVVVVIAILATISVVMYAGLQDRANGLVIQTDLANAAKKVQIIHAETGAYPIGGGQYAVDGGGSTGHVSYSPQPALGISVSRSSYDQATDLGVANFTYCTGIGLASGVTEYVLSGQTKSSRTIFQYSSIRGAERLISTSLGGARICDGIGYPRSISYGYFSNSGGWQSWTN